MAAEITAHCPVDGEVKIWATEIGMLLYPDDTGHYTFRCPKCREMWSRPATAATVRLLRSVHVQESRIRPHRNADVPLTEDDLIQFGRELETSDERPWNELLGLIR